MYQIVERSYKEPVEEIFENGFKQEWANEEFWENRENQSVIFETENLSCALRVFIDDKYIETYKNIHGSHMYILVFALYDTNTDEFLYISHCEIEKA